MLKTSQVSYLTQETRVKKGLKDILSIFCQAQPPGPPRPTGSSPPCTPGTPGACGGGRAAGTRSCGPGARGAALQRRVQRVRAPVRRHHHLDVDGLVEAVHVIEQLHEDMRMRCTSRQGPPSPTSPPPLSRRLSAAQLKQAPQRTAGTAVNTLELSSIL